MTGKNAAITLLFYPMFFAGSPEAGEIIIHTEKTATVQ